MSFKFLAGLALGAIVVHFLETPEGKAFLRRLRSDISRTEENIAVLADGLVQRGRELVQGVERNVQNEPEQLIVVVESNPVV